MIPTVLLAGFLAGALLRVGPAVLVGLACAVLWGLFVVSDGGDAGTFFGGVGLAIPNFAVGAIVGRGCRWVWDQTREARGDTQRL